MIKKISIGANIVDGPWGGGNLFFKNFIYFFEKKGIKVINHLADKDIDIILLTDPRKSSSSSSYTHREIEKYKKYINKNVIVIQRVNECDERKSTNGINAYYMRSNKIADSTVFVSNWLKNIYTSQGFKGKSSVILGGGNSEIFNNSNLKKWNPYKKFKIVSHHWSANSNKGTDIYNQMDHLLDKNMWKEKLEFTYIGNVSSSMNFKNIKLVKPLSGERLASELKKSNAYLTASLNEPSGNHHIEAGQCGLPILFIDSGGITEYCKDFGISYDKNTLEKKLEYLIQNYEEYYLKMKKYPHNNEKMMNEYMLLFKKLIEDRIIDKSNINHFKKISILWYLAWLKILNYVKFNIFVNLR